MSAGMVIILYGAVLYGVAHLFLTLTTYEQRHRWWYNFLAAILIFGGLGFIYEVIASRGSFIGL